MIVRGEYYIKIGYAHGYILEWYDDCYELEDATPIEITINQETPNINFYLSKAGSISGQVKDDEGNILSDANVFAFSEEFTGSGSITDEDGSYKIEYLPSGYYFVQVTLTGYISEYYDDTSSQDEATIVTVDAPNDTPGIDFTLTPGETEPPTKPSIDGPSSGITDTDYTFDCMSTDPDDDQIYYLFDWGDETDSDWFGPFDSGDIVSLKHNWISKGTYEVKVKAKDIYGLQSEWSDPLSISIPKNKQYFNLQLLRFLENHLIFSTIFRYLIGI